MLNMVRLLSFRRHRVAPNGVDIDKSFQLLGDIIRLQPNLVRWVQMLVPFAGV